MFIRKFIILLLLSFILIKGFSQTTCSGLGQTPGAAFPVCGTDTFKQSTVPVCGGRTVKAPGCPDVLNDVNPYWYKFTCYQSGTLGFTLTPNILTDDYDWQLFDITNRSPDDVYTDESLFVACNWSGQKGITGTSSQGTSLIVCGNTGSEPLFNPFSSMPEIIEGRTYILLVSHFSGDDQSGYDLIFGGDTGGTANITDPTQPAMVAARAICEGIQMAVKLNKKMKCSSINPDGSDFNITPAVAPIIAAEGINCGSEFDMDSVLITLGSPIPPGNYTISIKSDANGINLLDNCDRSIANGQSVPVTVYPVYPTPMDSLTKPGCAPDVLQLVFSKPMQCSSITSSGTEFTVSGPTPVSVIGAEGTCDAGGLSNVINVKLSAPIQSKGIYRINLNVGTDGNTVLNECGKETAAGSYVDFYVADTVSAVFNYQIKWGCKVDTIDFTHDGRNGVNTWQWVFDGTITSNQKDTSITYTVFGGKNATLTVSNGTCTQTYTAAAILLDNELNAAFEYTADVCPGDPALFEDNSYNRVVGWNWDFGNGFTSNLKAPASQFYVSSNNNVIRDVPVRLIVQNDLGCKDTAINTIHVVGNCYIAIPKGFTPNNDGLNDYLYPTNAYKAKDLKFIVYNRGGQKIFETTDWTNKWDGTFKGQPQDPGTYVWMLVYTNIDSGQRFNLKGTTVLIR
jgi:gliding motility-associated-like protein